MRNLILSLIVFTVAGCNSTSNVSKVQVQPKDSKCDLIAEAIGPMVATKWALKETNKTQKLIHLYIKMCFTDLFPEV